MWKNVIRTLYCNVEIEQVQNFSLHLNQQLFRYVRGPRSASFENRADRRWINLVHFACEQNCRGSNQLPIRLLESKAIFKNYLKIPHAQIVCVFCDFPIEIHQPFYRRFSVFVIDRFYRRRRGVDRRIGTIFYRLLVAGGRGTSYELTSRLVREFLHF